MNSEQFVWWLKGYLDNNSALTEKEVAVIKNKVNALTSGITITSTPWTIGGDTVRYGADGLQNITYTNGTSN